LSNQLLSINTGSLSNLSEEEAEKRYRNSMRQLSFYRAGSWEGYMVFFPEGENVDDFENRVGAELLRILSGEWPVNAAVVVGHRSTITAILNIMYALRRSPDDFLYDYHEVPLMSVFECSIEPIHAQVDVKLHLCASVSGMRGNL
jgi:broad specificity phosphatase PhoE